MNFAPLIGVRRFYLEMADEILPATAVLVCPDTTDTDSIGYFVLAKLGPPWTSDNLASHQGWEWRHPSEPETHEEGKALFLSLTLRK